jgi:uncharacterized protein (TIGR02271 family)
MLGTEQIGSLKGAELVGADGDKLGTVKDVYVDEDTGVAEFAVLTVGMFGTATRFVPLKNATGEDEGLRVGFTKDQVKNSPEFADEGDLSQDQEREIYAHYGIPYSDRDSDTGLPDSDSAGVRPGGDGSRPTSDDAMTRSEEELHVGTEQRVTGRVRLRKHIVTENVTKTVPVMHEEVRIEREPITDDNRDQATAGPEISEEEHELTLTEEVPVVETRTVPKERVRLEKDTVSSEEEISREVRKEQIESDAPDDGPRR